LRYGQGFPSPVSPGCGSTYLAAVSAVVDAVSEDHCMAETYQLHSPDNLPEATAQSYRKAMILLTEAGIPFLLGGAYALAYHSNIVRHTKDLDIFLKPEDRDRALSVLAEGGYRTEIRYDYWLAKAFMGDDMIDLIYRS